VVAAFVADPVLRWVYPSASRYLTWFPGLVRIFGGSAFATGSADCADGYCGAALWVAPGSEPDEQAIEELLQGSIDEDRQEAAFEFLGQMDEHHPKEPVWYLPFIGVDPGHQGRGHGSALLMIGLARADRDGLPAYLEASAPRNRALYERHGFEVVGEIQAGDSPPLWPMLRPAVG
jgi:ribosomal protein S18 acetylase RimI-like enzyme